MNPLETQTVQCPYCWESNVIEIDCSVDHQEYIEDCQVCCCPIRLDVAVDETGNLQVQVFREDE